MSVHPEIQRKNLRFVCEVEESYGETHRKKIKVLCSDNGVEYTSNPFLQLCRDEGIERHFTVRETPQQIGVAERMNQTLLEKVQCMLANSGLTKSFWAEALMYVCHLY